jgi:hypothetical protein
MNEVAEAIKMLAVVVGLVGISVTFAILTLAFVSGARH